MGEGSGEIRSPFSFYENPNKMTAQEINIVEACKKVLIRQLQPVRGHNGYPFEAVAKSTVLSLEHLVEMELKGLSKPDNTENTTI